MSVSSYNLSNDLCHLKVNITSLMLDARNLILHLGVENPMLVLIMGCVGLTLNIISAVFLHGMYTRLAKSYLRKLLIIAEHDHGPSSLPNVEEKDSASIELTDVCSLCLC